MGTRREPDLETCWSCSVDGAFGSKRPSLFWRETVEVRRAWDITLRYATQEPKHSRAETSGVHRGECDFSNLRIGPLEERIHMI